MRIEAYIVRYFIDRDEKGVLEGKEILAFNYFENQFFNSIAFIEMISDVEQEFAITFSDEHLKSDAFMTVSGLIHLIKELVEINENVITCH